MEDYYAILQVSRFAPISTIRESYRKLALQVHPDKNGAENATSEFQRLGRAWECLKDGGKRREYDIEYIKVFGSKSPSNEEWKFENSGSMEESFIHEEQKERARVWKMSVRNEYLQRLRTWDAYRRKWTGIALGYQKSICFRKIQLDVLTSISESKMLQHFHEAIERSRDSGQYAGDKTDTISKLLQARKAHERKLSQDLEALKTQLEECLQKLEHSRRRFEQQETNARTLHIQEALKFLGPRDLDTPLHTTINKRGQAINNWTILSRIKPAVKFLIPSLENADEGPWHAAGVWERVDGERICGRCDKSNFHVILECASARCPRCSIVVCNECYRELRVLREYELWVLDEEGVCEFFGMGG